MKLQTTSILPLLFAFAIGAQAASNRYIAVLKPGISQAGPVAARAAARHGVNVGAVYNHALRGFAFSGAPQAAQAIAQRADVAFVEPDQLFHVNAIPTGIRRAAVDAAISINGQSDDLGTVNGEAVCVAVLDTGVDRDHPDLNVVGGIRFYTRGPFSIVSDDRYDDGHFHGTHVSGTIGARDNGVDFTDNGLDYEVVGVAPGVGIYAVKVLRDNGSGSTSAIIAGVDHVAANAAFIHVANMSLGGGYSQALNDAVAGAVNAGVVFVVAAGNESDDAQFYSPASEERALTISALADSDGLPGAVGPATGYGADDTLATFSNYGMLVDLCAPGVDILSTYLDGGYAWSSGTSMASPHVAGAAALYIANAEDPYKGFERLTHGAEAVAAVGNAICGQGWTLDDEEYFSGDVDGSNEPLLNVGDLVVAPEDNNPPTIESVGGPYAGAEDSPVTFTGAASDPDGDSLVYQWSFGDGTTAEGQTVAHSFLWGGVFGVTLTVSDGRGGQDSAETDATIDEINDPPVADAGGAYSGLAGDPVSFDGSGSYDYDNEDGTTANDQTLSYLWDFGDAESSTEPNPDHVYAVAGPYAVTLEISDGLKVSQSQTTAVISDASSIVLEAVGYKTRGVRYADLTWTGAVGLTVDIYRDGVKVNADSFTGDGSYTDNLGRVSGTFVYVVRTTDGSKSSNEATVTF